MEEELSGTTNKYARVNVIRKYKNAYSDFLIIVNKAYHIDTGVYDNTFYTKMFCFICNAKCGEGKKRVWKKMIYPGNYDVQYMQCMSCLSKNMGICNICCMPKTMCTKAKILILFILKKHLHRDIIPTILNKIHQ